MGWPSPARSAGPVLETLLWSLAILAFFVPLSVAAVPPAGVSAIPPARGGRVDTAHGGRPLWRARRWWISTPSGPPSPTRRKPCRAKLERLAGISGGGADELADEYIDAVVRGAVEKLQQELVVFGRIDDDHVWRIGLYGIDDGSEQLVVDWRAPFAAGLLPGPLRRPISASPGGSATWGRSSTCSSRTSTSGEVSGTSPLLGELARSRGTEMRAAVATLQSEQDELVRLDPEARLVLRGGPGTGKTVVALHRAAWLVYNDTRLTAGQILVIGPSDRFLRFVSAVLPTLGESRISQTTFDRLLGPSTPAGNDERWLDLLDRFEAGIVHPASILVGGTRIREHEVAELADRIGERTLPWRDKRAVFIDALATRHGLKPADVRAAIETVWPAWSTTQVLRRLRNREFLAELGAPRRSDRRLARGRAPTARSRTRCGPGSRACR